MYESRQVPCLREGYIGLILPGLLITTRNFSLFPTSLLRRELDPYAWEPTGHPCGVILSSIVYIRRLIFDDKWLPPLFLLCPKQELLLFHKNGKRWHHNICASIEARASRRKISALFVIGPSSNWTEWSAIQGVIAWAISKLDERDARGRFEITSMITLWIVQHEV